MSRAYLACIFQSERKKTQNNHSIFKLKTFYFTFFRLQLVDEAFLISIEQFCMVYLNNRKKNVITQYIYNYFSLCNHFASFISKLLSSVEYAIQYVFQYSNIQCIRCMQLYSTCLVKPLYGLIVSKLLYQICLQRCKFINFLGHDLQEK